MAFDDSKVIDPGNFDVKITIYRLTNTKNEFGEQAAGTPSKVADAWAQRFNLSGRESFAAAAGADASKTATEVNHYTFRFVSGLEEKMVIIDGSKTFDITAIQALNRNQYHRVTAQWHG